MRVNGASTRVEGTRATDFTDFTLFDLAPAAVPLTLARDGSSVDPEGLGHAPVAPGVDFQRPAPEGAAQGVEVPLRLWLTYGLTAQVAPHCILLQPSRDSLSTSSSLSRGDIHSGAYAGCRRPSMTHRPSLAAGFLTGT